MDEILEAVPLKAALVEGLVHRAGDIGRVINAVEAHERARFDVMEDNGFAPEAVSRAWLEGLRWANELQKMLGNSGGGSRTARPSRHASGGGRSMAPKG